MTRNIIWDVDGTLLDTYPAITRAFATVVESRGGTASAARVLGLARVSLGHCARVLAEELGAEAQAFTEEFGERYAAMPLGEQGPFPGAIEVCRAVVDRGGVNAIVTHRGQASTRALLREHGMEGLFRTVVSVEDGYPKKPDPAAFHAVLRICALDAASTLAVGDRCIDIEAGRAAGLRTALFGEDDNSCAPDLHVRSYAELAAILRQGRDS